MRVLITGVPGWLGNRFVEVLTSGWSGEGPINNWQVRCLLLPETNPKQVPRSITSNPIDYVIGDITDPSSLTDACKDVDVVFHIAGIIHPKRICELYAVNTIGTRNLLEASIASHVKRFVYISSNSAAGIQRDRNRLLREIDACTPYMHYGQSKFQAETQVRMASQKNAIETVILRPCWYYGPNQPLRQTTFFKMIKKGNPLIFGNGNNLRSMSYVDNTCQALLLAAEAENVNGQTYWIADERPYTSNEIYETVADLLGVKKYRPRHVPDFACAAFYTADRLLQSAGLYVKEFHVAGEMNKNIACSIEKAQRELGYRPRIVLREGMLRSLAWCRQQGMDF